MEEVRAAIDGSPLLATGASSRVYKAVLRLQEVAIKVVDLACFTLQSRALWAREAELLASIGHHPNIVRLRGYVATTLGEWCS